MTPPLDRWALRLSRERCQLRDTIRMTRNDEGNR
jgi:hypothetical protein